MLTSSRIIPPVAGSRVQYKGAAGTQAPRPAQQGNYDSVSFSERLSQENNRYMDVVGRLTQEVRAATTTGDVRALHDEVASGQYMPDPMAIAGRILFLGDEV